MNVCRKTLYKYGRRWGGFYLLDATILRFRKEDLDHLQDQVRVPLPVQDVGGRHSGSGFKTRNIEISPVKPVVEK